MDGDVDGAAFARNYYLSNAEIERLNRATCTEALWSERKRNQISKQMTISWLYFDCSDCSDSNAYRKPEHTAHTFLHPHFNSKIFMAFGNFQKIINQEFAVCVNAAVAAGAAAAATTWFNLSN